LNEAEEITQIWSASAIGCMANKNIIETIALVPNVAYIKWDKPVPAEEVFDSSPSGNPSPISFMQPTAEIQWPVNKIKAPAAWDLGFTGVGVLVAILDGGVHYTHNDLSDHLWNGSGFQYNGETLNNHGWDIVDDDNDPIWESVQFSAHGTNVAGGFWNLVYRLQAGSTVAVKKMIMLQ